MPKPPVLLLENVSRHYQDGHVQALNRVNLEIHDREYVVTMGPSGSGKSTFLNLVGALDDPTEGKLFFYDQPFADMMSMNRFRAQNIGFVFQAFLLLPTMNALQNVQVPMFESSLTAPQRRNKAHELLAGVGLEHRMTHYPNELSVGEKQRVAIARALANDPPLLLADEPTGNLDSQSAENILDLFDQLHQNRALTIILVSHSDAIIERATRLIRLRDGEIESDETLRSIAPLSGREAETPLGPTNAC